VAKRPREVMPHANPLSPESQLRGPRCGVMQEYEVRCMKCIFGGGADRFTARYKLFTV
jgi:hypothetical protein